MRVVDLPTQLRNAWLILSIRMFCLASNDERSDQGTLDCGQKAISLVLNFCSGTHVSVDALKTELGGGPLTVREVDAYLRSQGLKVEGQRINSGTYYQRLNALCGGDDPVIGVLLFGATEKDSGHFFVVSRISDGGLLMTEPVNGHSKLITEQEISQSFILLLVSKSYPIQYWTSTFLFPVLIGILALLASFQNWMSSKPRLAQRVGVIVVVGVLAIWFWFSVPRSSVINLTQNDIAIDAVKTRSVSDSLKQNYIIENRVLEAVRINAPKAFEHEFRNDSDSIVEFLDFGQSCSCVKLTCEPKSIAPGESYRVTGSITVAHPGEFVQKVFCRRKSESLEESIEINLRGYATDGVWFGEPMIQLGPVLPKDSSLATVVIRSMFGESSIPCARVRVLDMNSEIKVELNPTLSADGFSALTVDLSTLKKTITVVDLECTFALPDGESVTLHHPLKVLSQFNSQFVPGVILVSRSAHSTGWLSVVAAHRQPFRIESEFLPIEAKFTQRTELDRQDVCQIFEVAIHVDESFDDGKGLDRYQLSVVDSDGVEVTNFSAIYDAAD